MPFREYFLFRHEVTTFSFLSYVMKPFLIPAFSKISITLVGFTLIGRFTLYQGYRQIARGKTTVQPATLGVEGLLCSVLISSRTRLDRLYSVSSILCILDNSISNVPSAKIAIPRGHYRANFTQILFSTIKIMGNCATCDVTGNEQKHEFEIKGYEFGDVSAHTGTGGHFGF